MNVLVIALDAASPVDVPESEVLVVAPALNTRLRRWLSDEDEARRLAGERADATVERLERRGLHAHGQVGDAIRCRRLPTRCRSSPPTRSSSRLTRHAVRISPRSS